MIDITDMNPDAEVTVKAEVIQTLITAIKKIASLPHSNPTGDTLHGPCPKCIAEDAIAKAEGRSP